MGQSKRRIGIFDILIPGDFCNTILLYGPPSSGKSIIVADDLPDDNTIVIDTNKTFPFYTDKDVKVTTNAEEVLASIVTGKTTVVDDIFVFWPDEIKKMMRRAIHQEARLILISQIRNFTLNGDKRYYPYMARIVENCNIWIKMERHEIHSDGKLAISAELVRKRGDWAIEKDTIKVPVIIHNSRVNEATYVAIDRLSKLAEMEKNADEPE